MDDDERAEFELPPLDDMLKAVGSGVQAFASVEFGVSLVFASLMEPADRRLSVVALDAARHFETKLRIVRAVAQQKLQQPELEVLVQLMNKCAKRAEFRNYLAHWMVSHWPGITSTEDLKKVRPALVPPMSSPRWGSVIYGTQQPIQHAQIVVFTEKCRTLWTDLLGFSNSISPTRRGDVC